MRNFASDNHAGVHPDILAALIAANEGRAGAYGEDEWTRRMEQLFREHFGEGARAFGVFNGSGANVSALDALTRGFEAVICAEGAHINVDECGAPERIAGVKLHAVAAPHGKLVPADVSRFEERRGDDHHAQQRIVSITQSTELGTVYTLDETRAIAEATHQLDMLLHVDGARLSNAAAALGTGFKEMTTDLGVDVVSFGATKNGLAFGEAVVFLRPELAQGFEFVRKQMGQLASKMRFLSAQMIALLSDDLWSRNASHANEMASRLAAALAEIPGAEIIHPVEANGVFARLPEAAIATLMAELPGEPPFYVWEQPDVVRLMCAWDTEPDDVEQLAAAIKAAI